MKKTILLIVTLLSTMNFAKTDSTDAAIVRSILDSAGWKNKTVESVTVTDSNGRIVKLDLTNDVMGKAGVRSLPSSIGTLSALRSLHLDKNDLTTLPMEIGFLHSLDTLDLQYNQIDELPPTIGNLSVLRYLDLRSNQLAQVPSELFELKSLVILKLTGNMFTTLPEEINNLVALKELYLMGNRLKTFPKSLLKMTSLTYVDFQDNQVCAPAPDVIAWMKKWDDTWKSKQKCW